MAADQDRVFSRSQLLAAGVSSDAIKGRQRSGLLVVLHRGVYSLGTPTWRGRLRAAVLAVDGSVLSHRAAGSMHDLLDGRTAEAIDVTTCRHAHAREGIAVHRVRALPAEEIVTIDGIPCTSVARTLVDLAATEPRRVVEQALDAAELQQVYDGRALNEAMRRNRPGAATLRTIDAEHFAGTTVTRNDFEEAFLALCRRGGLPQPAMNAPLILPSGCPIVDALWRDARVAVELDGRAAHLRRKCFESDRVRDVELTVAGFLPARFTWRSVTRKPKWVERQTRALLERGYSTGPAQELAIRSCVGP
ncbi:MAG: type IV toxin-antitoxin system AbiEi family antitoxin domain-containing protein [Thermoleophilaceae bacterium]|nr:type IV toxin-antitoxin system AbiEi family antitoxin domain-containing protein [Thermoleophilaceae bacterium]